MVRQREIVCEYQNYIPGPPASREQLYGQSCSNDAQTIERWKDEWLGNIRANKEKYKRFSDHSLGTLFGQFRYMPVIVAGAGPSLKFNVEALKDRGSIPLISCLHNFHFFEDRGIAPDYYVSLDAGEVTIEEVSEGGEKSEEEYWEITKGRTLLCFVGTSPKLLEKWRGRVLFFNAPVPNKDYQDKLDEIETFNVWVGSGGNVLGASMYIAKAYLGAGAIIFIGADFSFGYDRRFHSWDSKYDAKLGVTIPAFDVFGNKVPTWQSYYNFKCWFDYVCTNVPGVWINCTEGGCLGSYAEGNIMQIKQMDLDKALDMYHMMRHVKDQAINPSKVGENKILLF